MARSAAILLCAILALAVFSETVLAGGKGVSVVIGKGSSGGGDGGCKQVCKDVCKDKDVEECKDVEVPYEVCKDVTTTSTKKECKKECATISLFGKKGRKLQGGKGGAVTITLSKGGAHSCKDVCKDVPYSTTKKVCKEETKTEKKCTTTTKTVCKNVCEEKCDGGKGDSGKTISIMGKTIVLGKGH